ncbi:hypothetical protein BX600DRAFT_381227 [Xylariales sp. PMI_506]|nr:hypothetical protein BX600DRAFT_381227 [Xylariales sp. PMI_506]
MSPNISSPRPRGIDPRLAGPVLLWDHQGCIPLGNNLGDGDLLVLLSPVVVPLHQDLHEARDPFEPLGRALAARHPWVRHVPYTSKNGITSYHIAFIAKAKVVIFIITGLPVAGQTPQVEIADIARLAGGHRPQIIIASQDVRVLGLSKTSFPTILQLPSYAPDHLEEAVATLFGETASPKALEGLVTKTVSAMPRRWQVDALPDILSTFDITPLLKIWNECLPEKFQMERSALLRLLDRDGFGKHYVVRLPETGEIVGFCATYTTWAFSDPDYLVGSLAVLLVKPAYRGRGVGLSLHDHALDLLTRTRGVQRLQLGSTFPRLLSGIPMELASYEWFGRRKWQFDGQSVGRGREICDWLLRVQDWPSGGFATVPEGFTFRTCEPGEFPSLLQFLRKEALHNETMGMFEEYKWSMDFMDDIVLGLQDSVIVAAALIYVPFSETTAENDLPWARRIGTDIGGITCICIAEGNPTFQDHRNSVMIRLLDTCIQMLRDRGMQHALLDGVRGGDEGFQNLGFHKWARYREVWLPV